MKKVLLSFLVLAIISSTACSININGSNGFSSSNGQSENYLIRTETLNASTIQNLVGNSSSADFVISGDGDQKSYVEIYAHSQNKKHSKEDVERLLRERCDVEVQQNGNTVTILGKNKKDIVWSNSDNILITFKIHIPSTTMDDIHTSSGDLRLQGLIGDQQIKTTSGDVSATDIKGDLDVKTSSGDMAFSNIKGSKFQLETSSGDIQIENGQAQDISIGTSSGEMSLNNLDGNTRIVSASGDIKLDLKSGSLVATSASGDQKLTIENPKSEIKLSAGSGDVTLSMPKSIGAQLDLKGSSVSMSSTSNFSGDHTGGKSIYGKINGGGMPVTIRTGSGDINLHWN